LNGWVLAIVVLSVRVAMRSVIFTFVAIGFLMAGPSHADCLKPDVPACAVQTGPFDRPLDFDLCRKEMIAYKAAMLKYSSCAAEAGQPQEQQSAQAELESSLSQFNRRARGD
jgi:hypothetical protein